jgi:hypothetical protein
MQYTILTGTAEWLSKRVEEYVNDLGFLVHEAPFATGTTKRIAPRRGPIYHEPVFAQCLIKEGDDSDSKA